MTFRDIDRKVTRYTLRSENVNIVIKKKESDDQWGP
jgi:hypothetical protein